MIWKKYSIYFLYMTCLIFGLSACGSSKKEVHGTVFAMDTYMELTLYGQNADENLKEATDLINQLDRSLDVTDPQSDIFAINQSKAGIFSKDASFIWEGAYEVYQETQGNLDLTIYPVVKAWGFDTKEYCIPEEEVLQKKLEDVGMDLAQYEQDTGSITLTDGMELDFGAVAKGYTGKVIAEYLKEHGVESALLYLGGNVQLVGGKKDGSDYRIGIKNPQDENHPVGILSVRDVAVITSGGYERYFEKDGVIYQHIIDPKTGCPAQSDLISVTIVSKDGLLADAYSTALYVYGLEDAIRFWQNHSDQFEAVFYDRQEKVYVTQGLAGCLSTDKEVIVVK